MVETSAANWWQSRCHYGAAASQVVHLVADMGFFNPQSPQIQVSLLTVGGFTPAALQSKDLMGGATTAGVDGFGTTAPGLASSQILHLVAVCGFDNPHCGQFQVSFSVGRAIPAAAKSKALTGVGLAFIATGTVTDGFGGKASRAVPVGGAGILGGVNGLNVGTVFLDLMGSNPSEKSKEGSEATGTPLAASRAMTCPDVLGCTVVAVEVSTKVGSNLTSIDRTLALMTSISATDSILTSVESCLGLTSSVEAGGLGVLNVKLNPLGAV